MAQIKLINPGQPVADFSIAGNQITVAGLLVDAEQEQGDATVVVEVRDNGTSPQIGGSGAFLAHIEIPPMQFVEHYDEETEESERERLPLDPNTVVVTLWPVA